MRSQVIWIFFKSRQGRDIQGLLEAPQGSIS